MKCTVCGAAPSTYNDERFFTDDKGDERSYELGWCDDCLKEAMDDAINDALLTLLPEIRNFLAEISLKLDKLL